MSQSILRLVHEGFGELGEPGSELCSSFSLRLASHLIAPASGELAPESFQAALVDRRADSCCVGVAEGWNPGNNHG